MDGKEATMTGAIILAVGCLWALLLVTTAHHILHKKQWMCTVYDVPTQSCVRYEKKER